MMPEICYYYPNFKCPHAGLTFCTSPCPNCFKGELPLDLNIGVKIEND